MYILCFSNKKCVKKFYEKNEVSKITNFKCRKSFIVTIPKN